MGLDMGGRRLYHETFPRQGTGGTHPEPFKTERRGGGAHEYMSEGITLNISKAKAYKNGAEMNLTAQEFRLLSGMMTNSGNVMPREYILEALWDKNFQFVDDNTLSVYIRRLREKVEDDPDAPECIKTVRGVGYMWDKPVREA